MKNLYRIIIVITTLLCLFNCNNYDKKKEVDVDLLKSDGVEEKRKKYKRLDSLAKNFVRKNNLDSALYNTKKLVKLSYALKDSVYITHALYQLGLNHKRINNIDSAYFWYTKSKEISISSGDSLTTSKRILSLAKLESNFDLFLKSDSTAIQGLKYANNSPKANEVICSIYNCLGINSRNQGGYHDAIKYYNKAIQITNDSLKRVRYIANKAVVYKYEKNYKEAVKVYEELIKNKFFDEIDLKLKFKILDNYTYTKYLLGEKVDVNDFFKVQRLKDSIKNYAGLITNYSYMSDYFYNQNPDKSLFYAQKMYDLSRERERPNDRIEALDRLIKLVKGNEIRKYAIERNYLKDSIVDARRKSTNKLVKTIYNFDLLKEQKLKAEIKAEQQKSQKQLWIFTVILTILSSIVYFFYKREKNKKEKAIEVYNTETRLAKKIHDELANDVYAVMNTLQNTSITDERLLTRVEKIYAQTRDISHENSPVLTGEYFESFLKQLFLDFTNDRCKVIHKGLQEVNINQLAKEKQIVVYRALQELLVNMKKYSEATLVLITFSGEKNKLSIAYQDNGIGVENLSVKNGLQNMEIRIKSVGGFITFESKQEKGFQAKFQFKK
ncbi:sensor histidine kinase [Tenacibaculum ascidiaceicola]|uniref:sensor histidine kinase n=1 Tax=Tenacibaculum ascidiaceicola TaxID=1699411 RepID=UPI003CE4739E